MAATRRGKRDRGKAVRVRRFRPDDADGASAVMIAAFKAFLPRSAGPMIEKNLSPQSIRKANESQSDEAPAAAFVAECGGRVVGYISGTVNPAGFGTLAVIGVDPTHFHGGVGGKLMNKLMGFFSARKMRKVSTCVSAHNGRALLFYMKHGFRPVGYQKDHFLVGVDEVILDRFLV